MQKISKKLMIIKYGTAVLLSTQNKIDKTVMLEHGDVISKYNGPILMISSGAVGFGKTLNNFDHIEDDVIRKRALASLGNPLLSVNWDLAIKNKNILQALVTHRGLKNSAVRGDMKKIISEIYKNGNSAVIQFNENDFVSDSELKKIRGGEFGDNDKTATLVAELCSEIFQEVELIINTSADGVLNQKNKLIEQIFASKFSQKKINSICGNKKTIFGTGGMKNKLSIIVNFIKNNPNVTAYIINGKKVSNLKKILSGINTGTKIVF